MKAYQKQHQQKNKKKILQHLLLDMHLPILWTDEVFTVQATHNVQNDRVFGRSKEDLGVEVLSTFRCQGPASAMVWGGMMSDPLIFLKEGVKVNQDVYLTLLSEDVLLWVEKTYQGAPLVF